MRRTTRILPVLALALALIASVPNYAAAETTGHDGMCVFTGKTMEENFDSAKIAKAVTDLQPGDEVTYEVTYKNAYNETTDWYMENRIVQTLEQTAAARKNAYVTGNGKAENGGYTYELIQYDKSGKKNVLFSNSRVGGDKGTITENGKAETGLTPSTNALDEWFYIDTLEKGETGKVVLKVAFDGETEVNDYMDTDGELNVRFAVELPGTKTVKKVVKTGDQSNLLMWSSIAIGAGVLLLLFAFISKRRDRDEAGNEGGRA